RPRGAIRIHCASGVQWRLLRPWWPGFFLERRSSGAPRNPVVHGGEERSAAGRLHYWLEAQYFVQYPGIVVHMDIKRAYRFRFYPSPEQEQGLARTFGCARFVYNHMLSLRSDAWAKHRQHIGYHESSAALTALKKAPEHAWLND